jgi:soluble lytic murein transglycosylase-like protein
VATKAISRIIEKEEVKKEIPKGMLKAIADVESRFNPYAVNAQKKSYLLKTKKEATKLIQNFVNRGYTNISVGCLQIHYKTHKDHFSSIEAMLIPENNVAYAAALLKSLYKRYGSWEKAIKMYHTSNPVHNKPYYQKVMKRYLSYFSASAREK